MLKGVAEQTGAFYQHYPRVAAVVTVSHAGRKNAMAVAWHCPISFNPPYYGVAIAPKRYTYHMVAEGKQFGINFMPFEKIEKIAAIGGSTGSFTDKFTEFNLAEDSPIKSEVPILKDAYAAFECKVIDNRTFGDHAWIIGQVVAVHMAEDVFKENGTLDLDAVHPALYLGGDTYCSADRGTIRVIERK